MRGRTRTSSTAVVSVTTSADEVLVLWPPGGTPAGGATELWPVFVIVVADDPAVPLLASMDGSTEVAGRCRWSVADARAELIRMDVRAAVAGVRHEVEIVLSARCFLGMFDIVARGAAIGVTASGRARRFTAQPDHQALDGIAVLESRTSDELAELAADLCRGPAGD
jgi:hypothetical protein